MVKLSKLIEVKTTSFRLTCRAASTSSERVANLDNTQKVVTSYTKFGRYTLPYAYTYEIETSHKKEHAYFNASKLGQVYILHTFQFFAIINLTITKKYAIKRKSLW